MVARDVFHLRVYSRAINIYMRERECGVHNMNFDDIKTIQLYPTDHLFRDSERLILCGASRTGKTYLIENLVLRFAHRFYKIVLCGNRNRLLDFPQTREITEFYGGTSDDCGIYDPWTEIGAYDLKKNKSKDKNLLVIFDDMMETIYRSAIVSKCFSKGRHFGISTIVLLQSYFPTGSGTNLWPQIRNNSTIQIFTKARSQGEIGNIASRLEYGKKYKDFFVALYKKLVQDKRYGYLLVMLDCSDYRLKYSTNVVYEDKSPYLTVHTLN